MKKNDYFWEDMSKEDMKKESNPHLSKKFTLDGDDKLYSDIEDAIIKWNIDGTKTAGHLTRKILKLIPPYVKVTNKHISDQDEIIFGLINKNESLKRKLKNLKKKSYTKADVESLLHTATLAAANDNSFDFWDFIDKHLK